MPIPRDMGECIKHFMDKGKPRKRAIAICLTEKRRREGEAAREGAKRHLKTSGKE